jgi:phage terminase large subunit-like protein
VTDALDLLLGLKLEDGRAWGAVATDWQLADARAVLNPADGPRRHFWTRPRGASKTTDAGAAAVAVLLEQAPAGSRSYAYAGDREQAGLLIDSVESFRANTDGLTGALELQAWKVIASRTGASLEIAASDEASSWGIRPYLCIVSEFSAWRETAGPRRLWRSIFSALPKLPDSRLVVESNAGEPSHFAAGVLERARSQPGRWRVSEIPGPTPWLDPADLEEQRAELPEWEFARLHLNVWTEGEDRLTSVTDLAACVVLDGPRDRLPGRRYCLGLDVGLKNDRTVLSVCSAGPEPRVALDRLFVWQGSRREPVSLDVVEATVVEAWLAYGRPSVVCDPWQAAQLIQRLRRRRVRVIEYSFTQQSVSRLAMRLHSLIADVALDLPDDQALLDELAHVRLRETAPGVYRLDHDHGRHDDRAIALALAAEHLLAHSRGPTVGRVSVPRGRLRAPTGRTIERPDPAEQLATQLGIHYTPSKSR